MRKIIVILSLFFLASCSEENKIEKKFVNPFEDSGKMHNEILDIFYSKNQVNSKASITEKIKIIDEYFINEKGYKFSFSEIINSKSNLSSYFETLNSCSFNYEDGYNLLNELKENSEISINEFNFANNLLMLMEKNSSNSNSIILNINELEENILNNTNYSSEEQEKFLNVLAITKYSIEYWNNNSSKTNSKGMPWYVKDSVGAMTGMSTGLVGYATLLAGPIGGSLALIGSAAFSSMI
ncbi:MAG: hypothetical protein PWR03_1705 [Tenuifilum sp.]|jgi:hypothetical protein|uniref:hypothetical protein n=1 Tax=Tenuifilum sp. TaxID=2760880 RepID=UPI0024AB18A9|nr:hypothetical protein [Tenuifilum sp.]MDI3527522.1 hypothetical protein [Tenuifilum sp.]